MFRLSRLLMSALSVVLLAVAVMSLTASCDKLNVTPDITLSEQTATREAGFAGVSVQASGKWTLSIRYLDSSEQWASLTSTSGRGSKDGIILSYTENTSGQNRSLRVVLTVSDQDYAATFSQTAYAASSSGDEPASDPKWLELPALQQNDACHFYYHDMSDRDCRNYSFLWDRENLVAHWVAYPLNRGLRGTGSRTDAWGYDPKVPRDEQPELFSGFDGGYQRGHQLPSADRYGGNNVSTFYFTNMTPQLGSLNTKAWENLEGRVRELSYTSDTLYVVTGCVLEGSTDKAYDNSGKAVTVPSGYFKALLWYNGGSTYSFGKWTAAAIYCEHRSYGSSLGTDVLMSIDELEEITGIDFFVNLPDRVNLYEAQRIEAEDPVQNSFWTAFLN